MSGNSSTAPVATGPGPQDDSRTADVQAVLDALGDHDCRDILRGLDRSALTASECSDACDLPLSTTYRKLEMLAAADLIEEGLRIRRDGKHASQYRRRFSDVVVGLSDGGGFEVAVNPLPPEAEDVPGPTAGD